MRNLLKPLSFIPALFLMYMIFSFSGQTGDVSSQLSFKVSCKIVEAGDYIFDANLEQWQIEEWADKIHFITRKLAHMTVYFALAVAVSFPLYVYGMHGFLLMLTAGIICVGFACGDEYHQSFVAGRGPSAKDVAIDSVGIFLGIIVVRIIGWTGRKTIFRPKAQKVKPKKQKIRQTKKIKQKNIHNYQGDYQQQVPPYQKPPAGNRPPYPYPPYPDPRYNQGSGAYQGQPPYQASNASGRQPYSNVPYSDDPFVNPPYGNPPAGGQPPYQQEPYYNGRQPYQQPSGDNSGQPYQAPPYDDPYQDPDFYVQPPQDDDWDVGSHEKPNQKKKKKKKEKDWFFDL